MAQTRFAQMLSRRRKELRLSIPQAAKVLRMRESVLEAFEEGDFDHLPALGYAQGMVSSYARYLGLDSREVTELYEQEHEDYVRERTGRPTSGLARLSDEPGNRNNTTSVLPVRTQSSYGSAGSSRPNSEPMYEPGPSALPAPGYGAGGYGGPSYTAPRRYDEFSPYTAAYRARQQAAGSVGSYGSGYGAYGSRALPEGDGSYERRYTRRAPEERDERQVRQQAASARRSRAASGEYGRPRADYGSWRDRDDDITTRRVSSGQYRDDMRFGREADPYRPSSTRAGRSGGRAVAPVPERPNVRRRPQGSRERDPRARGRRNQPQPTGVAGVLQSILSRPTQVIMLGGLVLTILLIVILVFSVRSCASTPTDSKQVPVASATTSATTAAVTTSSEDAQKALSDAASKQAALSAMAATQETKVTVSVADGKTTWVEIVSDGEQKQATSITGAWSEEYVVTKSIEIKVGDPDAVTVEKNGERVQFTSKTGGVASLSIQGTDPSAATTDAAADGSDDSSGTSSSKGSSGSGSSSSSKSSKN